MSHEQYSNLGWTDAITITRRKTLFALFYLVGLLFPILSIYSRRAIAIAPTKETKRIIEISSNGR